jgi:hypothetical protein
VRLALGPPLNRKKANRPMRVNHDEGDDVNPNDIANSVTTRQWTHCASGLANYGGRIMQSTWLILQPSKAETPYRIYLDNVFVRRADGSAMPFYSGGKPPEQNRYENPATFAEISVEVADVSKISAGAK